MLAHMKNLSLRVLWRPCVWGFGLALLQSCTPVPEQAFFSPDRRHWVAVEQVEARPDRGELLPTQRLVLKGRWRRESLLLLEEVENLCATDLNWVSPTEVRLRLPLPRAAGLRVLDG